MHFHFFLAAYCFGETPFILLCLIFLPIIVLSVNMVCAVNGYSVSGVVACRSGGS